MWSGHSLKKKLKVTWEMTTWEIWEWDSKAIKRCYFHPIRFKQCQPIQKRSPEAPLQQKFSPSFQGAIFVIFKRMRDTYAIPSNSTHTFCIKMLHECLQSLLETEKSGGLTVYFLIFHYHILIIDRGPHWDNFIHVYNSFDPPACSGTQL